MRKADGFFRAEGLSFNSVTAGKRHPTHLRGLPRAALPRSFRLCSPSRRLSPVRERVGVRARPRKSFVPRQRPFKASGSLLVPWAVSGGASCPPQRSEGGVRRVPVRRWLEPRAASTLLASPSFIRKARPRHAGPFKAHGVGNDGAREPQRAFGPKRKSPRGARPWRAPVRRRAPAAWPSKVR